MDIEATAIPDVKVITPRRFGDERGFFSEVFNARALAGLGDHSFVQDNHALSAKAGTIRGLHFQVAPYAQGKLVRVARGRALDVAVDLRRASSTFGRHVAIELSAANWRQLWIPPGFAHGYCTLEPDTELLYKVTAYYSAEHDCGLAFDDPALGIAWPVEAGAATLSAKDRRQPRLADLPHVFE
ncbi:MAG: dTDP-4-dehydrorhamnose 3,5-epimerase [Methylobacteriaceae bacterium]|nr:dTDP-4-dehydrorhamnose 3,5-epimerase [Methylobacteriaceae bacterium]MBV9245292.1 dTDP-4-dehydrorhamnose 3,5-epimerase [Methylobacteriaceae bacterium]